MAKVICARRDDDEKEEEPAYHFGADCRDRDGSTRLHSWWASLFLSSTWIVKKRRRCDMVIPNEKISHQRVERKKRSVDLYKLSSYSATGWMQGATNPDASGG